MSEFTRISLFREFLQEGGNVIIDDKAANRIDLKTIKRAEIVPALLVSLKAINTTFEKQHGLPIWGKQLFQSREFLSGSAFHFFNLNELSDEEFVAHKDTVGDVDTQVDGNMEASIKDFLNKNKGKKFGSLTLIGYKTSPGQYISLWSAPKFGINIQIDLEFVEFDKNGKPTPWSQFAHSSSWQDLKEGIKGVAHKHLMSSLASGIGAEEIFIKGKTQRSNKVLRTSKNTFSVMYGLRQKVNPIVDSQGNHVEEGGLKSYTAIAPKESKATRELNEIFFSYFQKEPSRTELGMMGSYVGLVSLMNAYLNKNDLMDVRDRFFDKLWGKGAQGIYRGDKERDFQDKNKIMNYFLKSLNITLTPDQEKQIETYYKNYK